MEPAIQVAPRELMNILWPAELAVVGFPTVCLDYLQSVANVNRIEVVYDYKMTIQYTNSLTNWHQCIGHSSKTPVQ